MRELTAGANDAGQRLDRFTAKSVPLLPDALLGKYIRTKRIKINGGTAKHDTRLNVGDKIQLYISDEFFAKPEANSAYLRITDPKLDVIYEDANILLVNKQSGLLCHSGEDTGADSLIARIQARAYRSGEWVPERENSFAPALCNRIDRNTGGIVISAKNAEALRIINEKLRNREIDKFYLCAVHGIPKKSSGRLEGYIFKDAKKNQVYVRREPSPGARHAVTEYRTLDTAGGLSLLECRLITGRTHQIRAQLADAGYPLLGDGKYGSERLNRKYGEKRQALWSYKLEFAFRTDAGALNYLSGKIFEVGGIYFVNKYFSFA